MNNREKSLTGYLIGINLLHVVLCFAVMMNIVIACSHITGRNLQILPGETNADTCVWCVCNFIVLNNTVYT